MKKDIMLNQSRTGVESTKDINVYKDTMKPPQSYDKSEMSQDTGDSNPTKVRRNG